MIKIKKIYVLLIFKMLATTSESQAYQQVFAVNGGGDAHRDVHGIRYEKDTNNVGRKTKWFSESQIWNVAIKDAILYSTVHYDQIPYSFDIPVQGDGKYWLILKFVENEYYDRYMDVTLNSHTVFENFNVYNRAGYKTAYDEFVYFEICNKRLNFQNELSDVRSDNKITLGFVTRKGTTTVMISAIVLLKGEISEISRLKQSNYTIDEKFMQQERKFECLTLV
jgi:hypothetical protein